MSGGIAVTGTLAEPGVERRLQHAIGGTNSVGGGVTCPATAGNPDSHVAGPTAVTPNVVTGATFATTTPPACLSY
jgi:hypothetical protein